MFIVSLMATTQTAADVISARILALVASGVDVIDAMKAVCGKEATEAMIESLYTELRQKGGR